MSVIHDIVDVSISNTNKKILYFCSENRKAIEKVVNFSSAFWEKLKKFQSETECSLSGISAGERFFYLKGKKKFFNFTEIYNQYCRPGKSAKGWSSQEHSELSKACFFMLTDFHIHKKENREALIKAFLDAEWKGSAFLLISSPYVLIPDGFDDEIELIRIPFPDEEDICEIMEDKLSVKADKSDLCDYAKKFKGLSEGQIRTIMDSLRWEYGKLTQEKLFIYEKEVEKLVRTEKRKATEKDPTISIVDYENEDLDHAAGLENYISWLEQEKYNFLYPDAAKKIYGTDAPKGLLLTGVPGTGKTLMAKRTARELNHATLIQFRIERILSSSFGESESNLDRCLSRIESMAPCVLLIDEIEKAFGVDEHTHEVKLSMLGQLLDWMQNRKALVFTFITANSIDKIPPELLRDGRLSERFFVFMPTRDELADIMCQKLSETDKETEGKLFAPDLRSRIERGELGKYVVDTIGQYGQDNRQIHKKPFFTGANIIKLIHTTNNELRIEKTNRPYSADIYEKKLIECAKKAVPQGQSNMKDIVSLWFKAKENSYHNASGKVFLPFEAFVEEEARFDEQMIKDKPSNPYDQYMYEVIRDELTGYQTRLNTKSRAEERYANEK